MTADIWFWLIYVISILFGSWSIWPLGAEQGPMRFRPLGAVLVLFVLIGLLGWRVFGTPLK